MEKQICTCKRNRCFEKHFVLQTTTNQERLGHQATHRRIPPSQSKLRTQKTCTTSSYQGVTSSESKKIDKFGDKLLGVDLTEYYGGEDFEAASCVVISQLKYSTRNSSKNVTLSDLTKLKNSKKLDTSIISKLACAYKSYYLEFGEEHTLSKLRLKFISNRPISPAFKEKLDEIRSFCPQIIEP